MDSRRVDVLTGNPANRQSGHLVRNGEVMNKIARKLGVFGRYVNEVCHPMRSDPNDTDDPGMLRAALSGSCRNDEQLPVPARTREVKDEVLANTSRSVDHCKIGSSSFFEDGQSFRGENWLREVVEALVRGAP
jgi:2-hydroxychromene-2-carboxylate isomerase